MKILSNIQEKILKIICNIPDVTSFYFTGGTALSTFYLKHRKSNDLDFFTSTEDIIIPFSTKFLDSLKKNNLKTLFKRELRSFTEIFVESKHYGGTIIHIALDSPFRFEEPKNYKEFPNLKVDSLIDIATNKILTLFGRANLRDFIDVYFLLKEKFGKSELLKKAKQKDPGFDLYWFSIALLRINEFDENDNEMNFLIKDCYVKNLKDFFNQWRKEIINKLK